MGRGRGVRLEGPKNSSLVSEVRLPHFVKETTPFTPRTFVCRETHPGFVDPNYKNPYASRIDCMPASEVTGYDSSLRDMLELISKRLENLENKRYFLSPDFENSARMSAEREIKSAALIVARAAKSADAASKLAIAAAVACKSAIAEAMKIIAAQRKKC